MIYTPDLLYLVVILAYLIIWQLAAMVLEGVAFDCYKSTLNAICIDLGSIFRINETSQISERYSVQMRAKKICDVRLHVTLYD